MNILILYPFYNQKALMQNFASRLSDYNIYVDFICIENYTCEHNSSVSWPFFIQMCLDFIQKSKVELLKRVFKWASYKYFLGILFKKYDIVDFHAYYPRYNRLMRECIIKGVKFDITIWGSELMRASKEQRELMKYGFNNCYRIKMTGNLYDTMVDFYGNTYSNKYREVYFGSSEIEQIDRISEQDVIDGKKRLYGETINKKIIVCGYNGACAQNHDKMIEALSKLRADDKQSIHVVLPMTYGAQPNYLCEINNKMRDLGMSFTLLNHFLDPKEIAVIRQSANIVVNVQDTDALSDSLKGHLYCKNVCIFGEWLNYSPYSNNGIYYIKTSMEDITIHIINVLHHYDEYYKKCTGNHERVKNLFSWDATIEKQALVYGE